MPDARLPLLRVFFAILALPLALAAAEPPAAPAPPQDAALAGLWESEVRMGRGAGLWLDPNGDAVWGTGVFVDGTYAVREDRISMRLELAAGEDDKEEPLEGPLGTLTKSRWGRSDKPEESWERVGTSERITVEGTWMVMGTMGRASYQRLEPDGAMHLRTQVGPGLAGTWKRNSDAVEVRWKDGTRSTAKVVGNAMHVPTGAATEVVLTRRSAENWYALRPDPQVYAKGRTPQADREVAGLWENASKSRGGIGGAWWFEPSGRVLAATLVVVDATYEQKDARLVVRSSDSPEPEEMPLGEVGATTWRMEGEGVTLTKERIGSAGDPRLVVGTWRYAHYMGGDAYERFGEDGTFRFRKLITPAEVGTWSRDGDVLEVRWPHAPAATLRVKDGRLFDTTREPNEPYAERRGDEDWYQLAGGWGPEPSRAP